jgi:hypothetical protein
MLGGHHHSIYRLVQTSTPPTGCLGWTAGAWCRSSSPSKECHSSTPACAGHCSQESYPAATLRGPWSYSFRPFCYRQAGTMAIQLDLLASLLARLPPTRLDRHALCPPASVGTGKPSKAAVSAAFLQKVNLSSLFHPPRPDPLLCLCMS